MIFTTNDFSKNRILLWFYSTIFKGISLVASIFKVENPFYCIELLIKLFYFMIFVTVSLVRIQWSSLWQFHWCVIRIGLEDSNGKSGDRSFTLARVIFSSSGSSRDLCSTNLWYFTPGSQRRGGPVSARYSRPVARRYPQWLFSRDPTGIYGWRAQELSVPPPTFIPAFPAILSWIFQTYYLFCFSRYSESSTFL